MTAVTGGGLATAPFLLAATPEAGAPFQVAATLEPGVGNVESCDPWTATSQQQAA